MQPEEQSRKFIEENYALADRLAFLLRNPNTGQVQQKINDAGFALEDKFQAYLHYFNGLGYDVHVSMNALKENARGRTKDDIGDIRHVYLDLDKMGRESINRILNTEDVPKPSWVLNTSPGHFQVGWRVQGVDRRQAEDLLRNLAWNFGGDLNAIDITRCLRIPGFVNNKPAYADDPPRVTCRNFGHGVYKAEQFHVGPELTDREVEHIRDGLRRGHSLDVVKRDLWKDRIEKVKSMPEWGRPLETALRFHPKMEMEHSR